jgi:hypothetical protein
MYLDFSLSTFDERKQYIDNLLKQTPREQLTNNNLSRISDYLLFVSDKNQTKKEQKEAYPIITRNRESTVAKRQVSFEEMVDIYEHKEDSFYSIITNDKNQIMDPKDIITDEEINSIAGMRDIMQIIDNLNKQLSNPNAKNKYKIKTQIIETWKQAYLLRASARGGRSKKKTYPVNQIFSSFTPEEHIYFNEEGYPVSDSPISLLSSNAILFLLSNYAELKTETEDCVNNDMHSILMDLDALILRTFCPDHPIFFDVLLYKIYKYSNAEIKQLLLDKYGIVHTEQYISTLWRQRIPKMLVEKAQEEYLLWYYTFVEKGTWKTCRKCGETKLAHPIFFSQNNSSRDHFYSVCKKCRKKARAQ